MSSSGFNDRGRVYLLNIVVYVRVINEGLSNLFWINLLRKDTINDLLMYVRTLLRTTTAWSISIPTTAHLIERLQIKNRDPTRLDSTRPHLYLIWSRSRCVSALTCYTLPCRIIVIIKYISTFIYWHDRPIKLLYIDFVCHYDVHCKIETT